TNVDFILTGCIRLIGHPARVRLRPELPAQLRERRPQIRLGFARRLPVLRYLERPEIEITSAWADFVVGYVTSVSRPVLRDLVVGGLQYTLFAACSAQCLTKHFIWMAGPEEERSAIGRPYRAGRPLRRGGESVNEQTMRHIEKQKFLAR